MHMSDGVVFAVAGSKGGVGKTTTSINLSAVLTEAGYDVVLVEVDLAMANVGDFLDIDVGLEGEDPTLHEVLAGTATVVDATYDSPCAFDVVPSGATLRGYGDADIGRLSEALSTLRFAYDVVVLDTGAGVTTETVLPLAVADETILVSSPRVASVRDTMKTRDITRQVGGTVAGVVFVRSGTGRSPDVDHIADFLSVELLGHVPEDSAVANAQDVGLPVVVAASESAAAAAYRTLGDRVVERVEALGTSSSGVLSAESIDSDGSGFAFVDRPTTDDERKRPERETEADSRTTNGAAGERTNGRGDGRTNGAAGEVLSLTRTNGPDPDAVATPKHGPDEPDDADGGGVAEVDVGGREPPASDDGAASPDHDDEDRSPGPGDADGPDETTADVVDSVEASDADGPVGTVEPDDRPAASGDERGGTDAVDAATGRTVDEASGVDETDTEDTADDDTDVDDSTDENVNVEEDADDGDTADDVSETPSDGGETTDGDGEGEGTEPANPGVPTDSETADARTEAENGAQRDATGAPRSAPKRFLDRAMDLVDRRDD
ncbi:AAA family ATPase [Salinigranum sp.]|uniref:AAA family ATPase n=1 Tax=Salinigranum sp. TaxID=1966351 RepID=UPI003568A98D